MSSDFRHTREYRIWRAGVIRANPRCKICGSMEGRQAHHLNDATHYPFLMYDIKNGDTLCKTHHIMFHTSYMNSFQEACSAKDFDNFCELYFKIEVEITESIIKVIRGD